VGTTTAVARRYAGVTGLALGVAYAGPGIGVAVILPLAGGFIPDIGWRASADIFAIFALAALPFVLLMTSGPAVIVPAASSDRPSQPEACTRRRRRERSRRHRSPCRPARLPGRTPSAASCGRAAS